MLGADTTQIRLQVNITYAEIEGDDPIVRTFYLTITLNVKGQMNLAQIAQQVKQQLFMTGIIVETAGTGTDEVRKLREVFFACVEDFLYDSET